MGSSDSYDKFSQGMDKDQKSLTEIFPALKDDVGGTAGGQAISQFLAIIVTLAFAIVGGLVTGLIMHVVGKMERMEGEDFYNDDWNIDEMEAKEEIAEELKGLVEDWKNNKFCVNPGVVSEKSALLSQ